MKKIQIIALSLVAIIGLVHLSGCAKKIKAKPLSEVLKTVFYAQTVKHDNTLVYTKGAATNTVDKYKAFKLDFSSGTSVSLTDYDGNVFNGSYLLSADAKTITLSGLNPSPTGANGTITLNVISFTESPATLVLSRVGGSTKTGATAIEYNLTAN